MAKPKSHKSQHWVPKSYLSAWTDPDAPHGHEPYIHIFSKDASAHEKRAPKNTFTETDLYTIHKADGVRDLRMERGLAGLEKDFARIREDYLAHNRTLPPIVFTKLLIFVAAMHGRTPLMRDHHRSQWAEVLKVMDELDVRMRSATPEQKKRASSFAPGSRSDKSMSHDDVRRIVASPMEHTLGPITAAVAPFMVRMMHGYVLNTNSLPGFITSDAPTVWFDAEAYKRPPLFRTPALMYESLEITMPISPRQMLLMTRGTPGISYLEVPHALVAELNRRTRGHCDKHFVVCRDQVDPFWLGLGSPPDGTGEGTSSTP